MRIFYVCLLLLYLGYGSEAKGAAQRTAALTESMGQEIIEIAGPSKDLPPDLEEEPAAEDPEELQEDRPATPAPANQATPRRDSARRTLPEDDNQLQKKGKDLGLQSTPDEEARIEKELAEIYKDTDYKTSDDSSEVLDKSDKSENASATADSSDSEKEALRSGGKGSFKFQPDLNNPKEVEKFRTSVDEIACDKGATPRTLKADVNGSSRNVCNVLLWTTLMALLVVLLRQ